MSNIDDNMSTSLYTSFPFSEEGKENTSEGLFGSIKKVLDLFRKQITTNSSTTDKGSRSNAENTEKTPPKTTKASDFIKYSLDPDENRKELERRITAFSCGVPFKSIEDVKKQPSNQYLYACYVDLDRFRAKI